MSKMKATLRLTALLAATLVLTPLANVVHAADTGALTSKRDAAMTAFHNDMLNQQYKHVMGWPALTIYAAGDSVTSAKWSTTSGQNGVTARLAQIPAINAKQLTSTTTDFESELMGLVASKQNPRAFARKDYVQAIIDSQLPDGKFADTIFGYGEDLLNPHIYGILALYSAGVPIPNQDVAAQYLLSKQHADGGFNWANDSITSSVDVTAVALIALHIMGYSENDAAVQKALNYLKSMQSAVGGFNNEGTENPDSDSIVIEALLTYGIDPSTFKTNGGQDVLTAMLSYELPSGDFVYPTGNERQVNTLSTQNGAMALSDVIAGKSVFERLHEDSVSQSSSWKSAFSDLPTTYPYYKQNMRLVNLGVMAGNPDYTYSPDAPVTRDQIAKIIVYATPELLDQVSGTTTRFRDLSTGNWSNRYVKVAYDNKFIVGTSATNYTPSGIVEGRQMMAIVVRMLGLEAEAQAVPNQKSWEDGYLKVAQEHNLLYPNFVSTKAATRSQVAYTLNRYYEELSKMSN